MSPADIDMQTFNIVTFKMFSRILKFGQLKYILQNAAHPTTCTQRFQSAGIKNPERWSAERYSLEIVATKLNESRVITQDEWRAIRTDFMQKTWRINEKNVDGQILRVVKDNVNAVENAMSYINFLEESNIEVNLGMSNTLLEIYVNRWRKSRLAVEDIENIEKL